jgi:hypothetical protein
MESFDGGVDIELLKARVENQRRSVEQAEQELRGATPEKSSIWENRLNQRRSELEVALANLTAAEAESDELSAV